jgi:hypothetical protein
VALMAPLSRDVEDRSEKAEGLSLFTRPVWPEATVQVRVSLYPESLLPGHHLR